MSSTSSTASPAEAVSQIAEKIPSPQEAKETAQAAAPAAQSALLSQLRALTAGGFGGICAVIVGHPFDLVKVRLQTAERGVYSSAIDVVRKSVARDGLRRGLYAGVSAPLVGVTPMCMSLFFFFPLLFLPSLLPSTPFLHCRTSAQPKPNQTC